jgi:hypothetical protein
MQPGWELRLKRAAADSMAGAIENLNAAAEAAYRRQHPSADPTPAQTIPPTSSPR